MRVTYFHSIIFSLFLTAFQPSFAYAQVNQGTVLPGVDYLRLSDDLFKNRGGGDSHGVQPKTEKPIYLRNKCRYAVKLSIIFQNKSGNHRISKTLAPGKSGYSGQVALNLRYRKCTKASGRRKCAASVKSKARQWRVSACR